MIVALLFLQCYNKTLKKVGRNVYGSGDTIVAKTSQGLTLGAEGGLVRGTYGKMNL